MNMLSKVSDIARSPGDPTVLSSGPSSFGPSDRLARNLGWFSIGLGLAEIFAARRLTRALGLRGGEAFVRACGVREIASGVLSLSADRQLGVGSRVAGDAIDLAALAAARRDDNPKRENVDRAMIAVAGITVIDLVCLAGLQSRHGRPSRGRLRRYEDRSGLPRGIEASRGLARSAANPPDMRAAPQLAVEGVV